MWAMTMNVVSRLGPSRWSCLAPGELEVRGEPTF